MTQIKLLLNLLMNKKRTMYKIQNLRTILLFFFFFLRLQNVDEPETLYYARI